MDPDEHYRLARQLLDLDAEADREAASRLSRALVDHDVLDPEDLREAFEGQTVQVLGPRPGGAENLDPRRPIVAAGSAVRQALSAGIQPTLVVSDLDGSDMAHRMFSKAGVPIAVHGHGDNRALIEHLLPELRGPVLGTCQTTPPEEGPVPLHRWGGFTDGDRACFIAQALGADRLELVGWDFEEPIAGDPVKQTKLDLARGLLDAIEIPLVVREPREPKAASLDELDLGEGVSLDYEGSGRR